MDFSIADFESYYYRHVNTWHDEYLNKKTTDIAEMFRSLLLFEDENLLVVFKPPGILSQQDRQGHESILDYGLAYLGSKESYLVPVHRLDRAASGLLMLAKNKLTAGSFSEKFKRNLIKKEYWVVVNGLTPAVSGAIHFSLGKTKTSAGYKSLKLPEKSVDASILNYTRLLQGARRSLLKVEIETGRFHQVRAMLAAEGLPKK